MTVENGSNAGTRVHLSMKERISLLIMIISVVGSSVWWVAGKFAEQRDADVKQNERIAAIEAMQKRQEAESNAIAHTLEKLGDKIEEVQSNVAEIRTGVARIDERTRSK